jgi:hypothetical protein
VWALTDSWSARERSDFFDSGSTKIRDSSLSAFSRIAWLLADRNRRVRIEGHTDNRPIHSHQFSDNWDLATARATELVRLLLLKYGFAPERLSAAGYPEYHPVMSNDTAESRAQNRRVDVVILGKVSAKNAFLIHSGEGPDAPASATPAAPARPGQSTLSETPKPSAAVP